MPPCQLMSIGYAGVYFLTLVVSYWSHEDLVVAHTIGGINGSEHLSASQALLFFTVDMPKSIDRNPEQVRLYFP